MSVFGKIDYKKASKAMAGLALAGVLAAGITGCGDSNKPSPYTFNGKISGNTLIYSDIPSENKGILTVQLSNGETRVYVDLKRDKKLDSYTITTPSGDIEVYERDEVGSDVIIDAEKKFRGHLDEIKAVKVEKGLNSLQY
jgi:hypothetical protein